MSDIVERLEIASQCIGGYTQAALADHLKEAAAEITRLRSLTTWRPISDEAKNGDWIDAWGVNPAGRRFPGVRWHKPDYELDEYGATWRNWMDVPVVEHADAVVTNFLPLPPPPETKP